MWQPKLGLSLSDVSQPGILIVSTRITIVCTVGVGGEKIGIWAAMVAASQASRGLNCQRYPEADGQVLQL